MKTTLSLILTLFITLSLGQNKEKYQKISDSLIAINKQVELISYFENELRLHPKNENALRALGYAHAINENFELGKKYYLEALTVNPQCSECYLKIAKIYMSKEDSEKALENLNKAVNEVPDEAKLYSLRALIKESIGDNFGR